MIVGTYSSVFIAGALLLYVQPQRGGQKKTVGQAERLAAVDEDVPPGVVTAEAAPALPKPDAPAAGGAALAAAADAAEAALEEEGGEESGSTGSRKQRRASSARDRRRRRKRGKR